MNEAQGDVENLGETTSGQALKRSTFIASGPGDASANASSEDQKRLKPFTTNLTSP